MAETKEENDVVTTKRSKIPVVAGLLLAVMGAGGGFFAVYNGLIFPPDSNFGNDGTGTEDSHRDVGLMPQFTYVPIEPLVISLGDGISGRHLRFRAELEVIPAHRNEVETLMPRIADVLNSYLRALQLEDLTHSAALLRLRSQMLRRIQVVTGSGRINDLLIIEFVLN